MQTNTLHLMARNNELMNVFESLALNVSNAEVLSHPVRDVKPDVLRPIMQAARQQKRLDCDYVSLNHPDREGRIIVPHTLVYTGTAMARTCLVRKKTRNTGTSC